MRGALRNLPGPRRYQTPSVYETFEKCSILFKVKEGENFNRRGTLKYFED